MKDEIKEFYSKLQFPGHYKIEDLKFYDTEGVCNKYMKQMDNLIKPDDRILDIGCGTGFVSNFFAMRYPTCQITSVDFSDSIDYAEQFAKDNKIHNVHWIKEDFAKYKAYGKYDIIICCGVLHHMPTYNTAISKIKTLLEYNGKLALAVYNPYGKFLKRFIKLKYHNDILYQDQENNPYEVSFTQHYVRKILCWNLKLISVTPSFYNRFIDFLAMFNSRNGGLVLYIFEKDD
jgi:2-polyprenyl-3-methyl-5-hydroxy-6-metoxy-1,4-benzoquinol methylase